MPSTLTGTGASQRELLRQLAVDHFSKGHGTPLAGHFREGASLNVTSPPVEAVLTARDGRRLAICGDTKVSLDLHVVSS